MSEESAPVLWASLTMNLATAHLAVPMTQASDQLRLGVATQALRACRRVFTPESAPVPWSTATLNLANALVYTPSTHQGDNLVEAVELYDEVLESGVRDGDPWDGPGCSPTRATRSPTSAPSTPRGRSSWRPGSSSRSTSTTTARRRCAASWTRSPRPR
ncbi:MAG: hypothetical protein R2731_12540 [Nocardioides sp.]